MQQAMISGLALSPSPSRRGAFGKGLRALRNEREYARGRMISSSSQCVMAQTGDNEFQLSTKSLHFLWIVSAILGKMPDIISNGSQLLA